MFVNRQDGSIHLKIVYHGAGLCGKTTNLQEIFKRTRAEQKLSQSIMEIPTKEDKTLSYDIMPLTTQNKIRGLTPVFSFWTVPGQVHYKSSRKLILEDVDGIVFVADSQSSQRNGNILMLAEMKAILEELNTAKKLDLENIALVFQFNKRDLPGIMDAETLKQDLGIMDEPCFEASAINGVGVMETMQTIVQMTISNNYPSK
jgi:signal recognition particle receptor subunit beta